jgi:hypothetical protein
MCDPLTIAGIALSAGSAAANNAAANQQAKAQAAAMSAERSRQRVLDDEARGVNEQSRNRFTDVDAKQAEKTSQLTEEFTRDPNQGADLIAASMPRTNSNITLMDEAAKRGEATGFSNQQGEALARMRSFSDLFGGLGRDVARDGSEIGMIGGMKRGSQGVLPFELEAASMKGGNMRMLGDVLGLAGSFGVNAGLGGKSLGSLFGGPMGGPMGAGAKVGSTFGGSLGGGLPAIY